MKIHDATGTYETKSVRQLIKKYLLVLNISWEEFWKKANLVRIRGVFLLAITDFLDKTISKDDIATVADDLYYNLAVKDYKVHEIESSLDRILTETAELAFYGWKNDIKQVNNILQSLKLYYEENYEIIEEYIE